MKTIDQDKKIIELLKVTELRRIICDTDKGFLKLLIRNGESKYHLQLDSVPLDKELNDELMDLLFPQKEMIVPQVNKDSWKELEKIVDNGTLHVNVNKIMRGDEDVTEKLLGKKKGRPVGSKKK